MMRSWKLLSGRAWPLAPKGSKTPAARRRYLPQYRRSSSSQRLQPSPALRLGASKSAARLPGLSERPLNGNVCRPAGLLHHLVAWEQTAEPTLVPDAALVGLLPTAVTQGPSHDAMVVVAFCTPTLRTRTIQLLFLSVGEAEAGPG
ncbi:hypothetical protein ONE63_006676 [Megalurothrips usitatus]|uniref:Uncharacterized protein n=1 Tax=Megalurothrips usitatus TaxID=439358 RepID=A0AAV7XYA1_9NEOP|nr:hypothetical protein ONE63_006676 [Megalurothrips usitatus]